MRKLLVSISVALIVALSAGSAVADSIQNKFGVTGRLGAIFPSDSDFNDFKLDTDAGFIFGGGVIYGFGKNIAVEFDITHTWYGSSLPSGPDMGDFSLTNFAIGAQYRFADPYPALTPYVGAGLDFLLGDHDRGDVDSTVGGHVSGGADYFIMKNLALNAELKAVIAPETDIKASGTTGGNFDPSSISLLFGARYFF